MDIELVRVDRPLDDHLAQAVGRGYEHDVAEAGLGVEGEKHAARCLVTAHHLLDCGGERHLGMGEALVHPV